MSVALAGCGDDDDGGESSATTAAQNTTTTVGAKCSATGWSPAVTADSSLPAPVAKMRADIARAAATCDYEVLATLVDRNGKGIRYTFGENTDPVAAWEAAENGPGGGEVKPLRAMALLLSLRAGKQDLGQGHVQYAWPVAHTVDAPTDAQLQEIADTGLYDMATLKSMVAGGSGYLGYRILITAEGDWTAFVAGD